MKKKVYTAFICLCCAVVSLFAQERVVELTNPNESCTSMGLLVLGWRLCLPKTGQIPQNSIFIGISVIRKAKTTVWV